MTSETQRLAKAMRARTPAARFGVLGNPVSPLAGMWVPLAYLSVLLWLSPTHSLFNEWGGVMQYFAGQEILSGDGYRGWTARFWPPLYSFLVGIGSTVLPGFTVGKLISIVAASVLLYVLFNLAIVLFERTRTALWTQLFVALNPLFIHESLQAHNHMIDALFFLAGLLLFLRALERPTLRTLFIAGLLCGLAALSRYTSYVLVFLPLLTLRWPPSRVALSTAGVFWIGFALPNLPWWIYNAVDNGSPLYSWEYLNVCAGVLHHDIAGTHQSLWQCVGRAEINSISDVLTEHTGAYIKNVLRNLLRCPEWSVTSAAAMAAFVLPGLLHGLATLSSAPARTVFGLLTLSVLMVSQAFVSSWFLLPWLPVFTLFGVALLWALVDRLEVKLPRLRQIRSGYLILVALVAYGSRMLYWDLHAVGTREATYRPLVEAQQVAQALRQHDPHLESKVIMAIDPARAYYVDAKYVMTPTAYEGPVAGLVSYAQLDKRYHDYVPRYPSSLTITEQTVDYLVYTRPLSAGPNRLLQDLPQYSFLLDPQSALVPPHFAAVYVSRDVAVYAIGKPH